MSIKEMPLEEKYDKLLDEYLLSVAVGYALHKDLGVVDQSNELWVEVQKKMLPSVLGTAFKGLKAVSPGRAFKEVTNRYVYSIQRFIPISNIELNRVSDREAIVKIKNCPILKMQRDIVNKAGLDIDPRFICDMDTKINPKVAKEFGVELTSKLEENGCRTTAKLK